MKKPLQRSWATALFVFSAVMTLGVMALHFLTCVSAYYLHRFWASDQGGKLYQRTYDQLWKNTSSLSSESHFALVLCGYLMLIFSIVLALVLRAWAREKEQGPNLP